MITPNRVASQLRDYLQHRTTRSALVDWAERAIMDEEFDEGDLDSIRDITSRLGLADVREFGVTWETARLSVATRISYFAAVRWLEAGCRRHDI
jgi:hypothetical protein